jgi:hypothetical protein
MSYSRGWWDGFRALESEGRRCGEGLTAWGWWQPFNRGGGVNWGGVLVWRPPRVARSWKGGGGVPGVASSGGSRSAVTRARQPWVGGMATQNSGGGALTHGPHGTRPGSVGQTLFESDSDTFKCFETISN